MAQEAAQEANMRLAHALDEIVSFVAPDVQCVLHVGLCHPNPFGWVHMCTLLLLLCLRSCRCVHTGVV